MSLRTIGQGFPPATMSLTPGYFYREKKGKYNQKNILAAKFPVYLLYIPGALTDITVGTVNSLKNGHSWDKECPS